MSCITPVFHNSLTADVTQSRTHVSQVPLIFTAIFAPEATGGDLGMCAYVALFWVLSGYLNTCAYLVGRLEIIMSGLWLGFGGYRVSWHLIL